MYGKKAYMYIDLYMYSVHASVYVCAHEVHYASPRSVNLQDV